MLSQLRVKLLHNYVLLLCICVTLSTNTNNFVERYSHTGVTYYRQLLFDVHNYQLIVGARDYLLRVGLDSFATSRPEAHYIPADAEKQKLCERKGMKRWQCHNYITVLLPITATKQVLVCGTNAFSPECEIRQLMSLSTVIKRESGVSRSSFSPLWNTSALLTYSGDYYYAGPLDFRGIDAAITKHPSNQLPPTQTSLLATSNPIKKSILRTMQSDSKWINADANFVFNFEYENHIYFLFRESAVEYINCGKKIYSRIGRVCKNDVGGQLYYRENWTSFTKSRLNCSIPGLFPFYFDEIESVDWVDSGDVPTLYATFNTPENSIHGSAVCAYRIDAVLTAFHGLFKQQKSTDSMWQSSQADKDTFECQAFNKNQSEWHQMQRLNSQFQLMDSAVQSVNGRPYVIETNKRFQFIAVDVIQSKHHKSIEVMFVSTTDGWLMKYVRWPFATKSCLIDQFRVIANTTNDAILSMKLLRDTQSIYLGTKREIIRISVERCHQYTDKTQCELSGDPYCGWDQLKLACTTAPGGNPHSQEWLQSDSQQCQEAKLNQWSDWLSCNQLNKTIGDQCFCRMRSCAETSSSDTCINGKEVQVSNCTQHGGWTDWSQWSQCSATCGATNKYRYRKCSNPAPAFGGRQCRGPDKESIQCTNLPPCVNLTQPEPVKPINQWSDWSDWEVCSSKCGGGVQLRRRRCEYKDMYKGCVGCDVEWRICNRHECAESRQHSEWTDWLIKNITGDGVVEQRFRFICKSQTGEGQGLSVQTKIEERFIASNNVWSQCSDDACNGWQFKWNGDHYIRRECTSNQCQGWTQWTQWTQCMYGKQFRSRQCDGSDKCVGHYKEFRHCDRNNEQYVPNEENNSLDMINDKPVFRSSLSAEAESSNEQTVSLQKLVLFCILSFITGGFICGLIIYILLTKTERFGGVSHKRLSLRQFLPQKSTANAYESPHDYKSNSSVLSPLNSSIPPVREATIKRGSSIRAQLHSDQNF
ncbi:semaphorin-5A-like [Oppia nitens]|uniref:semaphorin-5A-like n=1 Tax=Oppia nitens TaxID=1686743 RepID=UPI0023DBD739|nr:semaphorin-5A-like [Oppia nitens]